MVASLAQKAGRQAGNQFYIYNHYLEKIKQGNKAGKHAYRRHYVLEHLGNQVGVNNGNPKQVMITPFVLESSKQAIITLSVLESCLYGRILTPITVRFGWTESQSNPN